MCVTKGQVPTSHCSADAPPIGTVSDGFTLYEMNSCNSGGAYVTNPCNVQCNDQTYSLNPGGEVKAGEAAALNGQGFNGCASDNIQNSGATTNQLALVSDIPIPVLHGIDKAQEVSRISKRKSEGVVSGQSPGGQPSSALWAEVGSRWPFGHRCKWAPMVSNHSPTLVWLSKVAPAGSPGPFKFFNFWVSYPDSFGNFKSDEMMFYKQKGKVQWLQEGDQSWRVLKHYSLPHGTDDMLSKAISDVKIKEVIFEQGKDNSHGSMVTPFIFQETFVKKRNIVDNNLLAQELVKGYARKTISPRCALKIDIQKVIDSLNWKFVFNILEAFGLFERFISWIKVCITSPNYSIEFNGNLMGYFRGAHDIRQGDQLSPYIFVLVMNVLSGMFNVTAANEAFRYHPQCKKKLNPSLFCY
ncbi:hypothetical protein F3Y22_tig00109972pilonHSYRG00088 [Hibiscus syriacus]|uniref:Reverse transcriptase domain-containing protein n=1 Tax=Hibiscus syriacus TaxID=106335 RepID=A0A6A3BR66_HIBSY|nr:hypothetical protein F3Y22_tig00109972pilonHSYRG00088 [Hibiscus syriacus]